MVLIPVGDGSYIGLSGDRPLAAIASGIRFTDNTGEESYWNGSAWIQAPRSVSSGSAITGVITGTPFLGGSLVFASGFSGISFSGMQRLPGDTFARYVVTASGSSGIGLQSYRTINPATGIIEYSGSNPFDAIQTAISGSMERSYWNLGSREVDIKAGFYSFGSGFSGFSLFAPVRINMAYGTILMVPPGYTGDVFRIETEPGTTAHITTNIEINGGQIYESGIANATPRNDWTAFHLFASGAVSGPGHRGVYANRISNVIVRAAGTCILIEDATNGWINANSFERMILYQPNTFIRFFSNSGDGSYRNQFLHFFGESMSGITRALVDGDLMHGSQNEFIMNDVSDIFPGSGNACYSMHIGVSGTNTVVVGGTMGYTNFYHSGRGLKLFDEFQGVILDDDVHVVSGKIFTSRIDISGISAVLRLANGASGQAGAIRVLGGAGGPTNNAHISLYDSAEDERMLFQHTATASDIVSQKQTAGGTLRPLRLQMIDTPAATTIESMRVDLSGNVEFNRSGGTVQFKSGNTSTTASGTNANSGYFNPGGFITARLGTRAIKIPFFD